MTNKVNPNSLMLGGGAGVVIMLGAFGSNVEAFGKMGAMLDTTGGRIVLGVLTAMLIVSFMFQQIVIPLREENASLKTEKEQIRVRLEAEREKLRAEYERNMVELHGRMDTLQSEFLQLTKELATANAKLAILEQRKKD